MRGLRPTMSCRSLLSFSQFHFLLIEVSRLKQAAQGSTSRSNLLIATLEHSKTHRTKDNRPPRGPPMIHDPNNRESAIVEVGSSAGGLAIHDRVFTRPARDRPPGIIAQVEGCYKTSRRESPFGFEMTSPRDESGSQVEGR